MSIRLRLVLWQTVLLGLVLAGFAVVVYATIGDQEASRLEAELRVTADDVRQAYYDAGGKSRSENSYGGGALDDRDPGPHGETRGGSGDGDGEGGNGGEGTEYGQPLAASVNPSITTVLDDGLVAQVVAADGRVLAWSQNRPEPLPLPPDLLAAVFDGRGQQEVVDLSVAGETFTVYGDPSPSRFGGQPNAVVVAAPLAAIEATLTRWRFLLGAAVLGTTALAAAIGWFLATQAMRPVDRMTRTARAIGDAADFDRRLPEPAQVDELGRLARTFNRMLGQLGDAFANQQRFLADASHELRTPLTVVRTNTEALLRGAAADPAEHDATLRAIARETERMGRLVGDLLTLARADAGQPLQRRPLPLDTLALEVYQQARTLANGRRVELADWEQVAVVGDADRLKQAMLNLVDNAFRHTPADGVVGLELLRRDGDAVFRVRDTGPGIAPEHLGRIFERFYRVDRPRSRQSGGVGGEGGGGSGTGLGLAIAREVAEAHGGRLEVESRLGAGATFSLVLPLAPSSPVAPVPAAAPAAVPEAPAASPAGAAPTLTSP